MLNSTRDVYMWKKECANQFTHSSTDKETPSLRRNECTSHEKTWCVRTLSNIRQLGASWSIYRNIKICLFSSSSFAIFLFFRLFILILTYAPLPLHSSVICEYGCAFRLDKQNLKLLCASHNKKKAWEKCKARERKKWASVGVHMLNFKHFYTLCHELV